MSAKNPEDRKRIALAAARASHTPEANAARRRAVLNRWYEAVPAHITDAEEREAEARRLMSAHMRALRALPVRTNP